GADSHAEAIDRSRGRAEARALAEDLVGLGAAFPFFLAHAVTEILVDPGDQAAAERGAEIRGLRGAQRLLSRQHLAVDLQDSRLGIGEQGAHLAVERAE